MSAAVRPFSKSSHGRGCSFQRGHECDCTLRDKVLYERGLTNDLADALAQWAAAEWNGSIADRQNARARLFPVVASLGLAPDDPEPQPSDGPDYHADHSAWTGRQEERNASSAPSASLPGGLVEPQ